MSETPEALLDAAEDLFARKGLQATSLREITRKARANLAAVHYHFGSKDALTRAVLVRRTGELNDARLRLLDEVEQRPRNRPVSLEEIMRAFLAPTAHFLKAYPSFMRLVGRVFSDPDEKLRTFWISQFEEIVRRFTRALARRRPDLPAPEIFWRLLFVVGAMIFTWTNCADVSRMSGGKVPESSEEEIVERLIALSVATFQAPIPAKGAIA